MTCRRTWSTQNIARRGRARRDYGGLSSDEQPIRLRHTDEFARLLLDHGATPNMRASLRKRPGGVDDETMLEYRDVVTPLECGERFTPL